MTQETIVAVYDNAAQADAAAHDLIEAGIPETSINRHASAPVENTATLSNGSTHAQPHKQPGFWAKLFGTEEDDYGYDDAATRDHNVYQNSMAGGGTLLSVTLVGDAAADDRVLTILERHDPVDIEERAASYGASGTTAAPAGTLDSRASYGTTATAAPDTTAAVAPGETQTIPLAAEELQVGKRVVNRGTTRIRRYVVETPVSENIALRNESVSVERRPVTGTAEPLAADAFTDKTVAVTAMNEEAVVAKTARVVEEVVVRKDVNDRVETIKDTVRHEELDVEKSGDIDPAVPTSR